MSNFNRIGEGYFVSYRDPNLKRTLDVYEGVVDYVKNFTVSDRDMTKYIIGTMSNLDQPMTPSAKGERSMNLYMNKVNEDMVRKTREEVLDATQEDIRRLAPVLEAILSADQICVIGSEEKIEEAKDLFQTVTSFRMKGKRKMNNKYKSGFVTLIGRPNVGKSTLMNYLIGQKIAITSKKPQTTRNRIQTVLTREDGQIIFVDTPGIHKAKNKLGEYMVNVAERTLNEVDVVLWLVEPTTFIGAGEQHIASQLKKVKTPVVLVINKTDSVKKEDIFPAIAAYKDVYDFADIVPVSARSGDNTEELLKVVMKYLPYGPQFYDEDTITDQPERQIVAELIREKALHSLNEEIPHGIAVAIDQMKNAEKLCTLTQRLSVREIRTRIIIGKQGNMLKKSVVLPVMRLKKCWIAR